MNSQKPVKKRRSGRREKLLQRAAPVAVNPCPPGQVGGQYTPLSHADCQAIYNMALRLLDDLGMGEVPNGLRDQLLAQGARLNGARVQIPPALVAAAIDAAPSEFTLNGRDPARSITVGGDRVHFGTGGAAVQALDLDSGDYRPSTVQDLYDFTRLQDGLENVSWFTRCCVATDMPDDLLLDVNTVFALLKGTTKPVATSFTVAENVAPIIEMVEIADGAGSFARHPWIKAHISPVISPMRYGEDAVDVALECIRHNIPMSCITAAQSGATAPATLAGFLAQSLAETLASLVMVHVYAPGYPMVFSNWPLVIDLRTGAFCGGGGEISVLNAASAQLINWLGLVSGVACSMTDAKSLDAQYGMEKGISAMAAGLAGGNLIYESAGMTASLLGVSFEAFLLDNDMLAHVYRALRGIEVSDDTLGYDAIVEAVMGEGHFLGGAQTMAAMERDYFYPEMADRDAPITWSEQGRKDAWARANLRAREILAKPDPGYLDSAAETAIRAQFDIRLGSV
ncbi:trimethylamine---corrinoid protein Co-methyltransferase [Shimia gijangensis]|uniref:Trimethylamine---corrinoid protein Co-methyltransferase n=1 Tax=Shimia gijangensis TaxID=1470563 RepID=A0A1M6IC62_9RHOB|nr:trimethylamine methyltransferase family protein [Shimia gijangensis]SHJ32028.1 trimethylamine---corrinoid protein Co-methyltransferase [Shimia gijangensis]